MPRSSPEGTSQTPKAAPQPKAGDPAHAEILTCRDITNTKNGTPTQSWRPSTCQEPHLPGHHKHQKRHPNSKLATQHMPRASPAGTSQTPKATPQPKAGDPSHAKSLTCRDITNTKTTPQPKAGDPAHAKSLTCCDITNTKSDTPTQSWRPSTCQEPHLPGHHQHLKRHPNLKLANQHMPRASPAGTSLTFSQRNIRPMTLNFIFNLRVHRTLQINNP